MLDDMRKYVRAGLEAAAGQVPDEMAGALFARAAGMAEQLSSLASGFMQWSAEARASLLTEVRQLIAGQVEEMGLATTQEVERLRRRIGELEERLGEAPKAGRGKPAAATTTSARRSTVKGSARGGSAKTRSAAASSSKTRSVRKSPAKRATASRAARSGRSTTSG